MSNIIKCPNCGNFNYDLCIVCYYCNYKFKMIKEDAEKMIGKYFHKDWKKTYIYLIFKNMKDGQLLQLENIDIMKDGKFYIIKEIE